jgi:hypothetical protein
VIPTTICFWSALSRCTQIADLTRVGQFPTLKSQTEPLQIGVKSRTVCAAPPAALLTTAFAGYIPLYASPAVPTS